MSSSFFSNNIRFCRYHRRGSFLLARCLVFLKEIVETPEDCQIGKGLTGMERGKKVQRADRKGEDSRRKQVILNYTWIVKVCEDSGREDEEVIKLSIDGFVQKKGWML